MLTVESQPRSSSPHLLLSEFSFHALHNKRAEADSPGATFQSQDPKRKALSNLTSVTISYSQHASAHTHCKIKIKVGLAMLTFANESLFMTTPCLERRRRKITLQVRPDQSLPPRPEVRLQEGLPASACRSQNHGPGSPRGPLCPLAVNCTKGHRGLLCRKPPAKPKGGRGMTGEKGALIVEIMTC